MIRDYKYESVFKLEDTLINLTVKGLVRNQKLFSFWKNKEFIFMPVPLYIAKRIFRGYDQSDKLISGAAKRLNLIYSNEILFRRKWTSQQSKLPKKERSKNVSNAFGVNDKSLVRGKNFVLFDDVYTTGSTLRSAASVLKSAGAGQIWGLTLCR
jgi:ComF family protein